MFWASRWAGSWAFVGGLLGLLLGGLLGRCHGVLKQHRPCHRTDASQAGAQPTGDLRHRVVDVRYHLLALEGRARGDHRSAGLHHVGGDDARRTRGCDDDVGLAHVRRDVRHPGMHHRYSGVASWPLEREQQCERAADREPPTDHHAWRPSIGTP